MGIVTNSNTMEKSSYGMLCRVNCCKESPKHQWPAHWFSESDCKYNPNFGMDIWVWCHESASVHRKTFGMDAVTLLRNNISDFFEYNREKSMVFQEFVLGFQIRLDNLNTLDVNEELKGHLLLKQNNPESHDPNLGVGAAGWDRFLHAPAASLKNAFSSKGLPPFSMDTTSPCYNHPFISVPDNNKSIAQRNLPVKKISGDWFWAHTCSIPT